MKSSSATISSSSSSNSTDASSSNAPQNPIITTNKKLSDEGLEIAETSEKYELTLHKDTRFWESIANRKLKAKKRKSRKFVSDKADHFSIDLSNHDGNNEEGGDGVSHSDGQSEDDGTDTWANAEGNNTGVSNEDLIAQLAYAEQLLGTEGSNDGDSVVSGMGGGRQSPLLMPFDTTDSASISRTADHGFPSADPEDTGVMENGPTSSGHDANMNKELLALEELEKELGLDDLNLLPSATTNGGNTDKDNSGNGTPSTSSSFVLVDQNNPGSTGKDLTTNGPTSSTSNEPNEVDEMDVNLDELEEYLQSINKT